jgi:ubiquinone/menaquinone biosynthesis C-methylase UbiE
MNERVFNKDRHQLRDKARMEMLEVDRVVSLSVEGIHAQTALDVGTGTAIFAEAFSKTGIAVAGIDINGEMVEEAKLMVPSADFKIGSAENIPYEAQKFDLVFLGHVLHETDDPVKALAEARRVGVKRIAVLEWPFVEQEKGPPLARRLKPEDVSRFAELAGLGKVREIPLRHLALYIMDIGRGTNE